MMTTAIHRLRRSWMVQFAKFFVLSALLARFLLSWTGSDGLSINLGRPVSIHGLTIGLSRNGTKDILNSSSRHEFPWWTSRREVTTSFEDSHLCDVTGYCVKQDQAYLHSGASKSTVLAVLGRPQWVSSQRGESVWVYQCSDGYLEVYWDYYLLGWFEPRVAMYFTLTDRWDTVRESTPVTACTPLE